MPKHKFKNTISNRQGNMSLPESRHPTTVSPEYSKNRINETRRWCFEEINKINKSLSKLTKRQRQKIQINKIRDKKGDITTDTEEI